MHISMKVSLLFFLLVFPILVLGQQSRFSSYTIKDGLSNNYVNHIVQDKTGYLWIATRMGLSRYNGKEFKNYFHDPTDSTSLPFNSILCLFVADDNTLWIGTYGSKIASFDRDKETFATYSFEENATSKDLDILDIYTNVKGNISLITGFGIYELQDGIFRYEGTDTQHTPAKQDSIRIDNESWMATNKGVKRVSAKDEVTFFNTENTPELQTNSFQSICRDRDGNLWFATHGGGIVKLSLLQEQLQYFSSKNLALKNNIISSFYKDRNGKLWVATDGGGISVYDSNMKFAKHIDAPGAPESNSVLDFAPDSQGWLWVAGWETGLFAVNMDSFEMKSFRASFSKQGITNHIKAVAVQGDTVLCGTYSDGIVLVNKLTDEIFSFKNNPNYNSLGTQLYINDILIDTDNETWVATTRGLYRYKQGEMQYFPTDKADPNNTDKKMIWCVREGAKNEILLSTASGAYVLNKQDGKIEALNFGMQASQEVKFMFKSRAGNYWIGSTDNLYIAEKDKTFASIKLSQTEYPTNILNPGAIYQDANSQMYIGTQDGFYSFHPDSLNVQIESPDIIFETLLVKNIKIVPGRTSILKQHINKSSEIALGYDDFPITVSFASIDFNAQTNIKFAYRFVGDDSTWTTVKGDNAFTFHNLAPGNYTVQLRNTNKYGKWSNSMRELNIQVAPPFWKRWWFRTLVVLLILTTIVMIFSLRVKRLRIQKIILQREVEKQTFVLTDQKKKLEEQADALQGKLLELHDQQEDLSALNTELSEQSAELHATNKQLIEVNNTKSKLLSIIAHDVKNPFNVILIAAKQLVQSNESEKNKDRREASELIYSASKNVYSILSNLLDWAMSQSGLLSNSPVNINIRKFLLSIENYNKALSDQKNIRISVSCREDLWCFADEQMIRIAIRNIFQNSVKFTPEGGMITMHCTEEESMVRIEIIDTGVGMDAATIERLFEVESVISEKGTGDEEGRGLGLLVVSEFITRNKGSIEVKSKKNNGSNFIVRLPKGQMDSGKVTETLKVPDPATTIERTKKSNINILLIDDNDKLREQLAKNLEDFYTTVSCANANEALEIIKTTKFHLIISDIMMGDIDGITLCNSIKNELKLNIPIILITGIDSTDMQVKAYNSGAEGFIKKPFELDVLLARIDNLLATQTNIRVKGFDMGAKKLKPQEDIFVEKFKDEVGKGISDPNFSVEILAQNLGTSRANLFKKTKSIIGISPSDYIQHARLEVASMLLKDKKYRISEVAYMVGFSDPHYFSNCFSKHYGISPTEYKAK